MDAVLAVEAAYDAAWNAGNLDELLACFADDAVLVNPRGETAVGSSEIRARLGSFLEQEARGSRHTSSPTRVSFLTDDLAIVDGVAQVTGGSAFDHIEHRYTDILTRQGGRWLIAHVRACHPAPR